MAGADAVGDAPAAGVGEVVNRLSSSAAPQRPASKLEVGGHRAAHHRGGRVGAGAAALDDHGHHDARVVVGRVADEPGVVLARRRPARRCRSCRRPSRRRAGCRTRWWRCRRRRWPPGRGPRGWPRAPAADVDLPRRAALGRAPAPRGRWGPRTRRATVGVHDRAAVRDRRVGDGHLERASPAGSPGRRRAGSCRRPSQLRSKSVYCDPAKFFRFQGGSGTRAGSSPGRSMPVSLAEAEARAPRPAAGTPGSSRPARGRAGRPPGRRTCRSRPRGPSAA